MLKRRLVLLCLSTVVVSLLVACGGEHQEDGSAADKIALRVSGNVGKKMAWTEEQVRAMDTIEAERENKEGELSTYTGVPIKALLDEARVPDDATMVTFVAEDENTTQIELSALDACADCIVSFRNQGGFSIVMPGFSGKLQVKGVVEIQVD
jgi:hypothetical protein